jgi:acyl-CoA synthetase (NDP forming)
LWVVVGRRTLNERDSKLLLGEYGARISREAIVAAPDEAVGAAERIGYPVVVKLVGDRIAHKSERGLVRLGLRDASAVRLAAEELWKLRRSEDGEVGILVAEQVSGSRELIVGLVRDPAFGAVVLVGAGGVTAEAISDTQMRIAPVDRATLDDMLESLDSKRVYAEFRNTRPVDRNGLWQIIHALTQLAEARSDVVAVDVNPVIVTPSGEVVAVDALVELSLGNPAVAPTPAHGERKVPRHPDDGFRALLDPRGVVVLGASTHPGKFGFVSLHNILVSGFRGRVAATNLARETVLGIETVASVAELPDGEFDLAFFCTPASANEALIVECAARGIKAAFLTSAGYAESDSAGRAAQDRLVELARQHGVLLVGPNGQGIVSTPSHLCAQIVAPYPPPGAISIASQSGNFVSSFMNLSRATGVGVSRAVSAGNAAAVDVADLVEWMSRDDATKVVLSYLEGVSDGTRLREALALATSRKPVVVLKGGASDVGARAAASHTGALASNDRVFDGMCRQFGVVRTTSVEEAFDTAALLATSPLPRGNRVAILTTAGGWGVVTADALSRDGVLQLAELSDDVMARLDELLPSRWSRNNPVDCAGGETRDTIPAVLEILAASETVDAVVYLGIGIQSNQARLMREGGFHPDHGLARIVEYHERQDERFAEAAADLAERLGKPILVATELAVADPSNAGPAAVRRRGGMCFPSGPRAVRALAHAYSYARYRGHSS